MYKKKEHVNSTESLKTQYNSKKGEPSELVLLDINKKDAKIKNLKLKIEESSSDVNQYTKDKY